MEKGMTLGQRAIEIHDNAVKHGWWEGKRDKERIFALIHCEWSEAIEEERAGRGMAWYGEDGKPEGIAVELVDGCIRILDYIVSIGVTAEDIDRVFKRVDDAEFCGGYDSLPMLVNDLHGDTTYALDELCVAGIKTEGQWEKLLECVAMVENYLAETFKDMDFYQIMEIKHNYNVTRPYKHGKVY